MSETTKEFLTNLYIKNSRIPKRYIPKISLAPTTENDLVSFKRLKAIEDNIVKFVQMHQNLLISSSEVGNGKTTWATRILKSYIYNYAYQFAYDNNTPVLYLNVPEYLSLKKRTISNPELLQEANKIEDCIYSSKIVLFDDIATKLASDYDKELLYCYINSRTDNLLTSIYTTNISVNALDEAIGERVADRLIGYSVCIELNGASRRY